MIEADFFGSKGGARMRNVGGSFYDFTAMHTQGSHSRVVAEPPDDWTAEIARGASTAFPVKPADLMPALQGAALGTRLKELEARWLQSDLRLPREALLG